MTFECDCKGECKGHEMTDADKKEFSRVVSDILAEDLFRDWDDLEHHLVFCKGEYELVDAWWVCTTCGASYEEKICGTQ